MRKRNSPAKRPAFESPGAVAEKEAADHDQHRGEHDDRQLVRVTRRERRSPRERVHQRASDNQGEPRTPPGRDVGEDPLPLQNEQKGAGQWHE